MFKIFLKEYFEFSSSARRGIWTLIILIILVFCFPFGYDFFTNEEEKNIKTNDLLSFDSALVSINNSDTNNYRIPTEPFDPNNIKKTEWIKFGINVKVAEILDKYIQKGGRFYSPSDIKKIFGIDTCLVNRLANFMIFPERYSLNYKKPRLKQIVQKTSGSFQVLEINTTDSAALEKLSGIGPKMASRIIKYRNLLGGFHHPYQLLEVYGLSPENYYKFSKYIKTDSTFIKKLDINKATEADFRKHPYIGKYKASVIIKYRGFKNHIISLNELFENDIFSPNEFEKILPYLAI